jgi:phage-related tail fiber protein
MRTTRGAAAAGGLFLPAHAAVGLGGALPLPPAARSALLSNSELNGPERYGGYVCIA